MSIPQNSHIFNINKSAYVSYSNLCYTKLDSSIEFVLKDSCPLKVYAKMSYQLSFYYLVWKGLSPKSFSKMIFYLSNKLYSY